MPKILNRKIAYKYQAKEQSYKRDNQHQTEFTKGDISLPNLMIF